MGYYSICNIIRNGIRVVKGGKLSANFGNFPGIFAGIYKTGKLSGFWEFSFFFNNEKY